MRTRDEDIKRIMNEIVNEYGSIADYFKARGRGKLK